jgi:hypothetical protein
MKKVLYSVETTDGIKSVISKVMAFVKKTLKHVNLYREII